MRLGFAAGMLSGGVMRRGDVWHRVRRRPSNAGIETAIGCHTTCCHTFRATGITGYLTNGGRIEVAQSTLGYSNLNMTGLFDRRYNEISGGQVERVGI